jgi:hypothetical protein
VYGPSTIMAAWPVASATRRFKDSDLMVAYVGETLSFNQGPRPTACCAEIRIVKVGDKFAGSILFDHGPAGNLGGSIAKVGPGGREDAAPTLLAGSLSCLAISVNSWMDHSFGMVMPLAAVMVLL